MACQKMKKQAISACESRSDDDCPREVVERNPSWNKQWHLSISCESNTFGFKAGPLFLKKKSRPALNELVQDDISTLKRQKTKQKKKTKTKG